MNISESPPIDEDAAISIRGLHKAYSNGHIALKGIDLDVPRGSIFGILGPNGAGKSTTINILAGLVNKTAGQVRIWGFDLDRNTRNAKMSLGVVPQEIIFDAFFTPYETLEFQAGLYGVPPKARRSMELLRILHLDDKAHAYTRTLSGGMKHRLLIGKALVHNPPILVLDEPTAGVDVELRQQLWSYVRELHARGATIILTTHYLEEAEELCEHIAIIAKGRITAKGTTSQLLSSIREKCISVIIDRDLDPVDLNALDIPDARIALTPPRQIDIIHDPRQIQAGAILYALTRAGLGIVDVTTHEPDLEDVFLSLVKQAAHE